MAEGTEEMITTREDFVKAALNEFESPLIGYATTFLHDVERARDVVQDTFIRLYQQDVDKVKGGLKAWLFTVCRNRALDVIRKERRITNLEEEQMARVPSGRRTPSERADLEERVGQVHEALNRLSENQREVILLKFEQGLSYEEISEVTGLSSGNVGFLLHTGLKRLRSFLPDDLVQNLTPQTA
ncbi:sigma-70 family RNA polymerase sigma factor [bacterium]|jgi:RNA polymerase sigma-70 factor (ECF subfamily)|nr:sigma-70 family RNA polymerase sigma factor [Akkermansiaceae bacterium]MDB4792657.1 sigma-70 family RNA polymerase sigma factor [bacterium]MDA7908036.1 sigma-70 family RNA polymerase sigma factor [Akkermansiaceae bacterium]MDA7929616.1 sigma-70 family RNA polymerase sigma factor [Akkermansiaceae bacterium]MDB4488708.1 sigma-70 family RNA polymerase sigma factor [Akkermansiaceae bacterium]